MLFFTRKKKRIRASLSLEMMIWCVLLRVCTYLRSSQTYSEEDREEDEPKEQTAFFNNVLPFFSLGMRSAVEMEDSRFKFILT